MNTVKIFFGIVLAGVGGFLIWISLISFQSKDYIGLSISIGSILAGLSLFTSGIILIIFKDGYQRLQKIWQDIAPF